MVPQTLKVINEVNHLRSCPIEKYKIKAPAMYVSQQINSLEVRG